MNAPRVSAGRLRIGLAVAAALLASACAAGQQAQTADEKPTLDGTNADVGAIALRAIAIEAPTQVSYKPGDDAPISIVLVNSSSKPDTLTSVRSSAASGWAGYNSAPPVAVTSSVPAPVSTSPATTSSPVPASSTTATGTATSTKTATPAVSSTPTRVHHHTKSAPAAPAALHSITIPAASRVSFGVPETEKVLLLTGMKRSLYPGEAIEITFTFATAGSVTVDVPVALTETPPEQTVQATRVPGVQ
ncbi:MAG TPA: hypothetical protein VFH38_03510 [Jatrophihabitans sp.]|nr:hypothetical protein [Jatrophihabitans sp.]